MRAIISLLKPFNPSSPSRLRLFNLAFYLGFFLGPVTGFPAPAHAENTCQDSFAIIAEQATDEVMNKPAVKEAFGISAKAAARPAIKAQTRISPRIASRSKEYLAIASWVDESLRTANLVDASSVISLIEFEPSRDRLTPEQEIANYGVVLKDQWVPKADVNDPGVQAELIEELREIVAHEVKQLFDADDQEEQELVIHSAKKRVLDLFERTFGPLPEQINYYGVSYTPQDFQRTYFPRYNSHAFKDEFSFKTILAEVRMPLADLKQKLTDRQMEILKKHPIWRWAKGLGNGSQLAFGSRFYLNPRLGKKYKGERAQVLFNRKILRALFPKAIFISDGAQPESNRSKVNIWTGDLGEKYAGTPDQIRRLEDSGATLSMNLGKAANTSGVRKDKGELRRQLGFPTDRKIVHFYIRAEDTLNLDHFSRLLRAVETALPLDLVIVTFGNHTETIDFYTSGILEAYGWNAVANFGGNMTGQSLPHRTLIQNTTVGRMSDLHRIADLSIVVGPVNFSEPVHVGTPTLLIAKTNAEQKKSEYGSYDRTILEEYANLAERSGIFRWHSISPSNNDYAPVTMLVNALLNAKESRVPLSEIAFKMYLDKLMRHLQFRMSNPDPNVYPRSLNFE